MQMTLGHSKLTDKKLIIASGICVLFTHLWLITFVVTQNKSSNIKTPSEKVLKLSFKKTELKKQIVQQTKANNKTPIKNSFLSAKNNTALKQRRSKRTGKFNQGGAGAGISQAAKQLKNIATKKQKLPSLKELGATLTGSLKKKKIAKSQKGMKTTRRGRGISQSSDFLRELPMGDFTELNTQEFEFYGYYHRIRQKLEDHWGNNVQAEIEKMSKSGRSIASSDHLTSLSIELDHKGRIVNIAVKSASGVKELDDTAVNTFNQAGPFPNPPRKMLIAGKVKLEWGFAVTTQ